MPATRKTAYQRFLKKLRRAREQSGMTQVKVARQLRRTQAYVSKCESGDRRVDVVELKAFAKLYGKSVSYFVDRR